MIKSLLSNINIAKVTVVALIPILLIVIIALSSGQTSASVIAERTLLPLPEKTIHNTDITDTDSSLPLELNKNWTKHQVTVKPNDSLSVILDRLGITARTSHNILQLENSQLITRLKVDDKLNIWLDENQQLQKIIYPKTQRTHHQLLAKEETFNIQKIELPVTTKIVSTAGTIKGSFYLSGKRAGLSSKTVMNLADIFMWEIDFIRQIREGDTFKVIYEQNFVNGNYIGDGDILAAKITTRGNQTHTAFLLRDNDEQKIGYFDINNKNLKKAFLRNPIDYVRISSGFQLKRFHPVLKKYRAHRGIDYAAPTGTPIRAAGNGKIIRRHYDRGYGNVIFIQHANNIVTVYGHMSRFGPYRIGQRVKQGTIIGYVGSTGLSTGPHLHYEFRINGKHVDPLTVEFPAAGSVPKNYLAEFTQFSRLMNSQMSRLSPETQLAGYFE